MNHVDCTTAEQQGVFFFLSEYTKEAEPFHRLSCHAWQLAGHTLAISLLEAEPAKLGAALQRRPPPPAVNEGTRQPNPGVLGRPMMEKTHGQKGYLCNGWPWLVISPQLHKEL